MLHRDLKPSTILADQNAEPQVTDFGLAKIVTEADSAFTLSATTPGSPSYMAPEQADPRHRDITMLTDVYGLGVVLCEMLSGRPLFLGKSRWRRRAWSCRRASPVRRAAMYLEDMAKKTGRNNSQRSRG